MKVESKISNALAAASCALIGASSLGTSTVQAENAHDVGEWDVSAAILFYQESDDRVQAVEPVITATKQLDTDETLSFKLTIDALTGASPNGAVPSNKIQTFTKPSGNGSYTTAAGDLPIDDTFKDSRDAFNVVWDTPIADDWRMSLGSSISLEYDYQSFGFSSMFAHDINNKNATLSGGLAIAFDQIKPEGDIPIAFGQMQPAGGVAERVDSSDDKFIVDAIMGLTQVINRQSLFQFNYSISLSDGYLTDPFKVISVVDAVTGAPTLASDCTTPIAGTGGELPCVVYEHRPDSRLKHAFYGQYKRQLDNGNVLDTSYRFMIDDWGIDSHTIDVRYRWEFGKTSYLQPHLRLYQQSEADFYQPFYKEGEAMPAVGSNGEASADTRLAEFTAYTAGLEYGQDNSQNAWSVALEYYIQVGNEPSGKFGELNDQTLFPDLDALMVRLIYDF